ncbi:DMT family transporter [Shimia thalassica]|uniref:DMT family transporter n=1 Tax=Shimia thalassica TaxID=1715693 RepID=UPI000C06D506|nr:DMT family transporter [Shimia thalassica]PHO03367.1 EamA family transporter [Rhodobacteraceae bacterium 4F10]MBU2944425.1 DMT family transporter [Shimia thalassica]MDO6479476.1 DMT family transporter [Shimia thalassica]MDO6502229.1 DMT family transporter [Shimia thalassica]MDO6797369.1 DMT family transporter [Shimia thalassica]
MNQSDTTRPVMGVFWMLITGLCFVAVTALVKYLGPRVPAAEAAFLRYLLGLVFLLPMIRPILNARLTRRQVGLFGLRGVVHTLGVICWFYAMTQIPIAEVTAMNYLSPVYVTIGAALFLGEKLATRRILAVVVALVGALIILRPGFREVNSGHMAMLFTAVMFAVGYLIAKVMSDEVSPAVVVGMLSITVTIGLAPVAAAVWVTPTLGDLLILFGVACFATAGHFTMTLAFAAAPITVTQPVTFLQLVWAVLLGWLVFAESVDIYVVAGGLIIIGSISFITWREAVLKRRQVTPTVNATKV